MGCSKNKKATFATIKEASEVMVRMNKRQRKKRVQRMYYCPYCEGYHLTGMYDNTIKRIFGKK